MKQLWNHFISSSLKQYFTTEYQYFVRNLGHVVLLSYKHIMLKKLELCCRVILAQVVLLVRLGRLATDFLVQR